MNLETLPGGSYSSYKHHATIHKQTAWNCVADRKLLLDTLSYHLLLIYLHMITVEMIKFELCIIGK